MKLGVFLPSATQGFIMTTTPPLIEASYALCREVTLYAEEIGFDFSMSMMKHHGFGGPSHFWDASLDSLALAAGLAGETSRIKIVGTVPILAMHPAVAARQAVTINEISGGRFILNLVTGWSKTEYAQYGMWPGDSHYRDRYDLATEYIKIMRDFWSTGKSNFEGKFFQTVNAECFPTPPGGDIPIVCAGRSEKGLKFTARSGDWSFLNGTFDQFVEAKENLVRATAETGRQVKAMPLMHLILGATDKEAQERFDAILAGADEEAIDRMRFDMSANVVPGGTGGTAQAALQKDSLFVGTEPVVGSYETVAKKLQYLHDQGFTDGFMFQLTDYMQDLRDIAEHVMPRLGIEPGQNN